MIALFVILSSLIGAINAYDITVGLTSCPTCTNYYKVTGSDSKPTLQQAAKDLYTNGGGTITILPGTYTLNGQVEFFSNTVVKGSGMDVTIFKLVDFATPWVVGTSSASGLFRSVYKTYKSCHDISFIGFTLDGNKANQNTDANSEYGRYGVFTEGCKNILMDSVHIHDFQGYGFDPHGYKTKSIYGSNLIITNCISNDNGWDGFTLDETNGITFTNNVAIHNGRHGINVVTGSTKVVISNCKTQDNGYFYYSGATGCGIMIQNNQLFGTNTVSVSNTVVSNDKKGGICTNDVFNIVMDKNTITTPTYCIGLINSHAITITNNACTSTKKVFISNTNTIDVTESGNTLSWVIPIKPADPTCATGIISGKNCCAATCLNCGGAGCSLRDGGSNACCTANILAAGKMCSTVGPPCLLA
jgi:hypothetical protein